MKATKIYTLLALLLMAGGLMAQNNCWDGTVAEAYAGGNGTPENPYQIATAEQLALLAQQTNDGIGGNAYYMLTDNICLNENPDVDPQNEYLRLGLPVKFRTWNCWLVRLYKRCCNTKCYASKLPIERDAVYGCVGRICRIDRHYWLLY